MSKPIDLVELADVRLIDRSGEKRRTPRIAHPPDLTPLPVRRTILIVDDDQAMLNMLVRVFEKENYDIITAASGADALRKAEERGGQIDLLVTDYAMPGMHGRALAERMREIVSDLPVLYETGFTDLLFAGWHELEERAAFIEKPFTPRGIREAARLVMLGTIDSVA